MDEQVIRDTLREAWVDFKEEVGMQLKERYLDDDSYVTSFKETFITGNPMGPIRTTVRIKTNRFEMASISDMVKTSFRIIQLAFRRFSESSIQRVDDKIYMQFKDVMIEGFTSTGQCFFRESGIGGHDFKVTLLMEEEAGFGVGAGLTVELNSNRGVWGYDNKPKVRAEPSSPMLGPSRPPLVNREDWREYLKENNLDITGSFFATEDTKLDALLALQVFKPQLENPDSRLRQKIMSILRT